MGYLLKLGQTARPLLFLMIDSTDHVSAKTGLSPTVTLSKNGAAFGSPAGAVTEIANGWYKVAGNATDTGTLGPLLLHASASGADPADLPFEVVSFDPEDAVHMGLSALPNAAAEAAGGLYTRGSGAGQINQPANGRVDANAVTLAGTALTGRDIGASVLLSSGTGTGQVDVTSGVVKANLAQILGTALTETAGLLAGGFKKFFNVATPTGTANSLPDAVAGAAGGLFIAGSNAATTANITGSITGSLSGSVGSVTGAVGSVTAGVTVTTNNDKAGYTASTVSDKTGYALSSAGVQAIWDALTSALTTVGSIGKLLVTNLDATVSSRLAGASYTAPDNADIATILARTDVATSSRASATDYTTARAAKLDDLDATISSRMPSGNVTVGGYATGEDPASLVLATPANKLTTDASGRVTVAAIVNGAIAAATFAAGALDAVWSTAARTLTAFGFGVTASTVSDKTGYALTAGEHTAITTDAQTGLTAQGYTAARAGYLDTLNGLVQAIWDKATSALTTAGSAGKLLVDNLDAPVSSVGGGSAPTAAVIAGAVWDEAIAGHLGAGSTGAKLNAATGAGGSGSVTFTYTVYEDDGTTPLDGCEVYVTTDLAGSVVVAGTLTTDAFGVVVFQLDPGTFFFWRKKSGWNFLNPDTEIVS